VARDGERYAGGHPCEDRIMRLLWPDPRPVDADDLVGLYAPDRTRPSLRVNFVSSLDGAVTLLGVSEGLSGPADKLVFGLLRMHSDALLVGAGTVRNEGYHAVRLNPERRQWRLEHGLAEYPPLIVVSQALNLSPAHRSLAEAPVRPIVLTCAASPEGPRAALSEVADVMVAGDEEIDFPAALAELRRRGLEQVLCEGGPHLMGALTAADLVDDFCLTAAPLLAGPGAGRITAGAASPAPRRLELRHVLAAEGMLLTRYARPAG
jgi:riboflavin biosynthesis pyrimidine reductase